jgi:hypothetical protein
MSEAAVYECSGMRYRLVSGTLRIGTVHEPERIIPLAEVVRVHLTGSEGVSGPCRLRLRHREWIQIPCGPAQQVSPAPDPRVQGQRYHDFVIALHRDLAAAAPSASYHRGAWWIVAGGVLGTALGGLCLFWMIRGEAVDARVGLGMLVGLIGGPLLIPSGWPRRYDPRQFSATDLPRG